VEDTGDEVNELCDELVDVPPVGDRLLLFLSDTRCPHEVLEAHSVRYAVTLWYMDSSRPGSVELPKLQ
jgi:hypoxia-inducible factor (prolyl hydroxylase)